MADRKSSSPVAFLISSVEDLYTSISRRTRTSSNLFRRTFAFASNRRTSPCGSKDKTSVSFRSFLMTPSDSSFATGATWIILACRESGMSSGQMGGARPLSCSRRLPFSYFKINLVEEASPTSFSPERSTPSVLSRVMYSSGSPSQPSKSLNPLRLVFSPPEKRKLANLPR